MVNGNTCYCGRPSEISILEDHVLRHYCIPCYMASAEGKKGDK